MYFCNRLKLHQSNILLTHWKKSKDITSLWHYDFFLCSSWSQYDVKQHCIKTHSAIAHLKNGSNTHNIQMNCLRNQKIKPVYILTVWWDILVMLIHSFCVCSYCGDRELRAVCYLAVGVRLLNSCHKDTKQSCSHKVLTSNPTINHSWNVLPLSGISSISCLLSPPRWT